MSEPASELARLRADRLRAAETEEYLRSTLERERLRRAALELEIATVRRSVSFRLGLAAVLAVKTAARSRPSREGLRRLRPRLAPVVDPAPAAEARRAPGGAVLVLAWSPDAARVESLVARVGRLEAVLAGFTPVFLVGTAGIDSVRRRGYAFEHLLSLDEWRTRRAPQDWGSHVAGRIGALVDEHRPGLVIVLEAGEGPGALDQGLLDALLLPASGRGDDNLVEQPDPVRDAPAALLARLLEAEGSSPEP